MTVEREADRRLRAWISDGVDHVPERFVWAALEEIERQPQRPRWRPALDDWAVRFRSAGLVAAAAIVLVALAAGLRLIGPNLGPGGERDLTLDDLPRVVLSEDTMPASWTLDFLVTDPRAVRLVPVRSLPDAPAPDGYIGGRHAAFSGPDAVFISWAIVFERDVDAAGAMPFYEGELGSSEGWGLGQGTRVDLGDRGILFEGDTTRLTGAPGDPVPARLYLWRHANTLLALGGWFSYDPAELDAIAAAMDGRASDSSNEEGP